MKEKSKYNFLEPTVIMAVVVTMIVFAVGVYAVFTVATNLQDEAPIMCETFDVTGSDTQTFTTHSDVANIDSVSVFSTDTGWSTVSSSLYSASGRIVTVQSGAF